MTDERVKRVLIADDSKAFRDLEGDFLAKQGYELLFAENGAEAVRIAATEKPDLILLDVQMPLMDGVQALSVLKREEATRDIPVVVITTISREEDQRLLRTGGADAVLSKPIQGQQLLDTIAPLMR